MRSLRDIAAEVLRRRNIDPATPTVEPPPFDPTAWRVQQAELALSAIVPTRFSRATVDNPHAAGWVDRFLADRRNCPSLLLTGEPGTGKTHLAYAILRDIALRAAAAGTRVTYRAANHPTLSDQLRPKPDNSHEWALEPYMRADLLLLDDLGAGRQSEWGADGLYRLIDYRWSEQLPTIYATNLGPAQLAGDLGDRIVSRVFDTSRIKLAGDDRRRTGGASR